jgi:uncharacterized membrane protein YccC
VDQFIVRLFLTSDRFINAFKTTLACLIGMLIVRGFNLPMGQWLIITILVVMSAQIHVGGALQKGYLRFIGTLLGAGIAAVTLWLASGNKIIFDAVVLGSALFFSYIAGISQAWGQAGTLGAVTVTILLLTPNNDWHNAIWRTIEILFGIVLALGVSVFILPIRASKKWRIQLAKNLIELKNYYHAILNSTDSQAPAIEEKIMQLFLLSRRLQDEALNEPQLSQHHKKLYLDILLHEKRLFRAFSLLESYVLKHAQTCEQFVSIQHNIDISLMTLAKHLERPVKEKIVLADFSQGVVEVPEQYFVHFFLHFVAQEIPALATMIEGVS